ncbi:MAG: PAS domain S-box protein [Acidobacteriota bacterium]|nr:MAG: PAS domain S-box protein [Acidobacteriota bacterium]
MNRVAFKVSAIFAALIVLVLAATAYVNTLDDREAAMISARNVSRMYSRTLIDSLDRFMTTRDLQSITVLVSHLARNNPVFEDIRLLDHEGRAVVSFDGPQLQPAVRQDWPCRDCHVNGGDPIIPDAEHMERITERSDGLRVLSLVTPIRGREGCRTARCHVEAKLERPLGHLQVDYSLHQTDELVANHRYKTGVAVVLAIVLCAFASWFVIQRLISDRISRLTDGIRRVTNSDFDFRFREDGEDEFSILAASFNEMTGQLSSTVRQLRRTREYLEGIIENSADLIITVDPEGLIRTFNAGAERILGYKRDEVIGERVEMLFSDPRERDLAIQQLEFSDHVVNYETHFLTKEGRVRDVILTLSRLRRRDGTPVGTYGISKDVTREKRLQRQLVQSEKMAALGQAITGIQHSIKNLLNVLKGGSYMVKTGLAKGDDLLLNEGWEMVQEGIDHMTKLSSSMLEFARERKLELTEMDLGELVRKVFVMHEPRFREQAVQLRLEIDDGLPFLLGDSELIHSVLMDLLSNALDACSWKVYEEGEEAAVCVNVESEPELDAVTIRVRDNGEGIPEELRAKLFTPFFSTKKGKGTGMGLAVVARIVRSHGGRITVDSEPGEGAEFRIILPVRGVAGDEEEGDVEEGVGR